MTSQQFFRWVELINWLAPVPTLVLAFAAPSTGWVPLICQGVVALMLVGVSIGFNCGMRAARNDPCLSGSHPGRP